MAPSTPSFSPWVSPTRAMVKSAILIQTLPIARAGALGIADLASF